MSKKPIHMSVCVLSDPKRIADVVTDGRFIRTIHTVHRIKKTTGPDDPDCDMEKTAPVGIRKSTISNRSHLALAVARGSPTGEYDAKVPAAMLSVLIPGHKTPAF